MQDDKNKLKYYQILGLDEDASSETVKRTYSILLKKYKDDKEKIEEIDSAYNHVMGYYVENEEEEQYAASNAGKFNNFWYHNKWPVIVIMLTTFALVVLIINVIRSKPADVNLHLIGDLYVMDINDLYDDVETYLENSESPNIEVLTLEGDTLLEQQFASDARIKLMSLIASDQMDVIVSDIRTFEYLASQGLFMPLDVTRDEDGVFIVRDGTFGSGSLPLNATLNQAAGKEKATTEKAMVTAPAKKDNEYVVYAVDNLGTESLFGIRLEGTKFFDFTNVTGKELILSIYHNPSHYDLAFEMADMILNLDPAVLETDELDEDEDWE